MLTYRNGRVIAMGTLAGQVAIVTGAGQGVGRGIARAVAAEGAKVVVLGRTKSKCGAVASEIRDLGGEAIEVQCDVEHRDQIEASVELVLSTWGRLDLLVNNAQSMVFRSIRIQPRTQHALSEPLMKHLLICDLTITHSE